MRKVLLASCGALSLLAAPAMLQAQSGATQPRPMDMPASPPAKPSPPITSATTGAPAPTLTKEQRGLYDAWTPDQRRDYESWPNDYKVYYWTLNAEQQKGYWALTPDQRGQIYQMTPEQRQTAWNSVVQQLRGETPTTPPGQANPPGQGMPTTGVPDPRAAGQAAPPAMPADPSYQGGPYKGALTPPPATAMDKEYPRCTKTVTDNCRNPGGK
jgi:hypothetical protein